MDGWTIGNVFEFVLHAQKDITTRKELKGQDRSKDLMISVWETKLIAWAVDIEKQWTIVKDFVYSNINSSWSRTATLITTTSSSSNNNTKNKAGYTAIQSQMVGQEQVKQQQQQQQQQQKQQQQQ